MNNIILKAKKIDMNIKKKEKRNLNKNTKDLSRKPKSKKHIWKCHKSTIIIDGTKEGEKVRSKGKES